MTHAEMFKRVNKLNSLKRQIKKLKLEINELINQATQRGDSKELIVLESELTKLKEILNPPNPTPGGILNVHSTQYQQEIQHYGSTRPRTGIGTSPIVYHHSARCLMIKNRKYVVNKTAIRVAPKLQAG